ncbi:MAG: M14 family metallopeptidase [Chloroflexota bacterium]
MTPTIRHLSLDHYLNYVELTELLTDLAAAFPKLTQLHNIGTSHRGRTIWLLEIHNPETGPADEKPGYYIDANIHAEEISGTSVVVHTAWTLLSQYGQDPLVTRLVDEQVFYLVPRVNPDGAEIVQTMPFYEWIGNGRYLPGEEQFGAGLHYADINGDGEILDMRLRDDAGEWKISEQDQRLMLPRDPDEVGGDYYRVVPEGRLIDWQGGDFVIPNPQDGNLNRNYPSNWVPESQQYGSGEHPLSEPEIAAVVRWILDHPNIAGMQCYHTHSGVILRPWLTYPDSHFKGSDKLLYEMIGEMGVEETGYPLISVYNDFTPDKNLKRFGSSIDWTFGALGIPTFSTELWDVFKEAGIEREDFYPLRHFSEEDQLKLLRWQDDKLDGQGFKPWIPFDHPQLGPVEIGGWRRMYTFRNPPPEHYLAEMARTNCRFTLRHAACAPRLRGRNLTVEKLAESLYQIRLVIDNMGFLATNLSDQALAMQEAVPVQVTLNSESELLFVDGQPTQEIGHLAGRLGRNMAYTRFYDWPASNQAVSWTVRLTETSAQTLTIRAGCSRSGFVTIQIEVEPDGSFTAIPPSATSDRSESQ